VNKKLLCFSGLVLLVTVAVCWLPPDLLSLSALQHSQAWLAERQQAMPVTSVLLFFVMYVLVCGLSFPGATLLTLLAGAMFSLWQGILLISFASTAGATLAMLTSRYLLRGWVATRFARQMTTINTGIARDGAFYLFALRLMPLFPFFVVNLLAGLTHLSLTRYWWVSQLGMLPATVIYLNAGQQLSKITSLHDIVSPGMLLAFALLGLLPLVTRKLMAGYLRP